MGTDGELIERVFEEVDGAGLAGRAGDLALAAVLGADDLQAAIGGGAVVQPAPSAPAADPPPPTFLGGITVKGFRGIAGEAILGLTPGPGLTLVVGRNGSGKSSFADGAELALTGTTARWAGKKSKVWEGGWANLHHEADRLVEVRLAVEGQDGPTKVLRSWKADDKLEGGSTTAQLPGEARGPVEALGLAAPMKAFRPFLPYSELSGLLEEGPSKLYDAISGVLGLGELTAAIGRLKEAGTSATATAQRSKTGLATLKVSIADVDDPRAATAATLLAEKAVDLDAVRALVTGSGDQADADVAGLEALAGLTAPDASVVGEAVDAVLAARAAADAAAGTDAGRADRLATLLQAALGSCEVGDCPVCGTADAIDGDWADRTRNELDALRVEAAQARAAAAALAEATQRCERLRDGVRSPAPADGVDVSELTAAVAAWSETPIDALTAALPALQAATSSVIAAAKHELAQREDRWQPLAVELAAWTEVAEAARLVEPLTKDLKKAGEWLTSLSATIRAERFKPIAEKVQEVWGDLRQSSNVSLEAVDLVGNNTSRKVELKVSVDGTAGGGLAVMSQGELHAIALSLFLPRATLPDSPFRFLVIDDPVQAMDAARVDGLARTLDRVTDTHQVVVFTHDERLPEACRRLGLSARVLEVTRNAKSEVSIRKRKGPVEDYIADARAVLKTDGYPVLARRRVVPGLCRNAVEAACTNLIRQRRIGRGQAHLDVEVLLDRNSKLLDQLGLAIYDEEGKTGDIYSWANRELSKAGGDTIRALNSGSHKLIDDDPELVVANTEKLVKKLQALT